MNNLFKNIKKTILFAVLATTILTLAFYVGVNFKTRLNNDEQFNIYVYNDICLNQTELTEKINDVVITEKVKVDYSTLEEKLLVSAFNKNHIVILTESYLDTVASDSFFRDISYLNGDKSDPYLYNGKIIGIKIYDKENFSGNDYMINDYFDFTENMYLVVLEKNYYPELDNHIQAFLGEKNEYEIN